jgi:hypothetical protein
MSHTEPTVILVVQCLLYEADAEYVVIGEGKVCECVVLEE